MYTARYWIFFVFLLAGCILHGADGAPLQGKTVVLWNFENSDWMNLGKNVYPPSFVNNTTWGKKDIEIRPCQGYNGGTGLLIHIKGISQGQMQFWTPSWKMWKHKFYKITFRAKGDFSGKVGVMVRGKRSWTVLIRGTGFRPAEEWTEYTFAGPGHSDRDTDFGIMFFSAGMGKIMLDDIRVEEFDEHPLKTTVLKNSNPPLKGNLIPDSSFESARNRFWTTVIPGGCPISHWEDPRAVRAENGKFGKSCLMIPAGKGTSGASTTSIDIPVASGYHYTLSFWGRAPKKHTGGWIKFESRSVNGQRIGASKAISFTPEWKRYSITTSSPVPELVKNIRILFPSDPKGEYYLDGIQFELGTAATEYNPAHPYEIEAAVSGGLPNIVDWGEKLSLELSAWPAVSGKTGERIPAILKVVAYPEMTVLERNVNLEAGKTLKLEIDPPVNGIYRLMLIPKDPKTAAVHENIAARLPKPRTDVGKESFFGTHFSVRPYFVDYAKRIGIKWERLHDCSGITKMKWGNPSPGVYRWMDEAVDAIRKAGIHIIGLPDYPAPYAKRPKGDSGNPIDVRAYAEWCRKVAEHYKGRIDTWEIWNEPYINGFYPGNAKQFAELFEAGFQAVRKGNPDAKIVGWCTELAAEGFASNLPKEKISGINAVSFHAYFSNAPGDGTMSLKNDLTEYRKKILTLRDPGEYWNTEGSWGGFLSFFYSPYSNAQQHIDAAAAGARLWIEQKKAGIDKFFYYTLHQTDGMEYRGGYKMLIEYDRTVTVSAVATAVTAWFIDGLDPKPFPEIPNVVQSLFSGKGRTCYVVHDDAAVSGHCRFDVSRLPVSYQVRDVMGTDLRKGKEKVFDLSSTPVFVLAETADYAEVLKNGQACLVR